MLLFVKSICTDLDSLSFIRRFLVQIATLLTADYSFLIEISTVSPIVMTAVSSANVAMMRDNFLCRLRDDPIEMLSIVASGNQSTVASLLCC
jgi:hypothetical protein